MKRFKLATSLVLAALTLIHLSPEDMTANSQQDKRSQPEISSRVVKTEAGERILIQKILIDAPIAMVWDAYTTSEGWTGWASPVAEIDLRAGGTISTHYGTNAEIGSPGTITLHIVNYVPERVLTLRAELQDNWPEVMVQDAGNLMNVVLFEPITASRTRVMSYGCGYGTSPAYEDLMQFFISANEGLYVKLKRYLEKGERASFGSK